MAPGPLQPLLLSFEHLGDDRYQVRFRMSDARVGELIMLGDQLRSIEVEGFDQALLGVLPPPPAFP